MASALCALAFTSIAQANLRDEYQATYEKVDKANAGPYQGGVAGRNLAEDGVLTKHGPRKATDTELRDGLAVMDRMIHPAPVAPVVSESVAPAPSSSSVEPAPVTTSSGNATVSCEAGGDYAANTGNGYYGGYQFDSQTWDAYGDSSYGEANEAPPEVQDQAAASVPYDAWPNCP